MSSFKDCPIADVTEDFLITSDKGVIYQMIEPNNKINLHIVNEQNTSANIKQAIDASEI